jgi:hypothetical protein
MFSNLPGAQRFRATDKILSRQTDVYLLTGSRTEEVVDAARRAALVDDPRIVRIIDAGRYADIAFVLTTPLDGVSLADVGPLPATQARAVAGEVAAALAVAASHDVHHLALRPELVFLGTGDSVQIGGMAWDAAMRGIADEDPVISAAADATALVAILYAALTARWPGQTPSVMPTPPVWDSNPVAPIELVSGVPGDLNTLCTVALAVGGAGPTSAQQVVDDLGLWPTVRITLPHSATVRGPIAPVRASADTAPDQPQESLDGAVAPASEQSGSGHASERGAGQYGSSQPGAIADDEAVAALARQAVIQNKLAAIEAIVAQPGDAPLPPPDQFVWDEVEPDRVAEVDPGWITQANSELADPGTTETAEPGEADASDGIGQDEAEPGEGIWPTGRATPPPALSSLAEQLDPAAPTPPPRIIVKASPVANSEPEQFALPPLPEDLAELLASVPPLQEETQPYEPMAVGDVDGIDELDQDGGLDDAPTLILEPLTDEPPAEEPEEPISNRPPNRFSIPIKPAPLTTPVSRESIPPGPNDDGVREILDAMRPTPPPSQPVSAVETEVIEPTEPEPAMIVEAAATDVPGVAVLDTPAAAVPRGGAGPKLFSTETTPFDKVLDRGAVTPTRNWWPIIAFVAVVIACLALGFVILQQIGILSLGVPLSPGLTAVVSGPAGTL